MNISEISKMGASNIQVVVSLADLNEFFEEKIAEAAASKPQKEEKYLTKEEVCEALKVSSNTLWRWNKNGYLCHVKVGRTPMYKQSDINKLREGKGE